MNSFNRCLWRVVSLMSVLIAAPLSAEIQYYHQDSLGSTRVVTNSDGEVVSRHDYLPFGEEIPVDSLGREAECSVRIEARY